MAIDTKKFEELCGRQAELSAKADVCMELGRFVIGNAKKCNNERNFTKSQAWTDMAKIVIVEQKKVAKEMDEIIEQLEKMGLRS